MAHLPLPLLEHFERSHGIVSTDRLRALGLTEHEIRELRTAGSLERVLHGAYRLPAVPFDEIARCAAVCAAHPEAVIAGPTAGRLWGFRRLPADRRVHAIVPPHSQPTISRWVVPYRTAAIHPEDIVHRDDGIVVTSRPRTALDMARFVTATDLLSIVEQAMHDGAHDPDDFRRVAIDWISPRRRFVRRFLEVLDRRGRGGPAESHQEVLLGDALMAAGVHGLVRQFDVDLPGYGPARFDLAVPSVMWAIEVDGHPTHRETAGRRRDRARDDAAARIDWFVTRVGPEDLGPRLPATVSALVARYRSRKSATADR